MLPKPIEIPKFEKRFNQAWLIGWVITRGEKGLLLSKFISEKII